MIPFYRTDAIESSINLLSRHFPRVVACCVYELQRPLRLRANLLEAAPFFSRYEDGYERQISAWQKKGGVLVNYRYPGNLPEIPHEAQLFVECPMSLDIVHASTKDTSGLACVTRPLNWRAHESQVALESPTSDVCKAFSRALLKAELPRQHRDIAAALELPPGGVSMPDSDLSTLLDFPTVHMEKVRRACMPKGAGKRYWRIQPFILRVDPEARHLAQMYAGLKKEGIELAGVRYMVNRQFNNISRYWRRALNALVRCGSVQKLPSIGYYLRDDFAPDFSSIEAAHIEARSALDRMIDRVAAAPTLDSSECRRLARQARSLSRSA